MEKIPCKKGNAIYLFNKPIRFNAAQSIITESFCATRAWATIPCGYDAKGAM